MNCTMEVRCQQFGKLGERYIGIFCLSLIYFKIKNLKDYIHTHTPAHKMWKCWAGCFEMECKHISEKEGGHGLPISQCQIAILRFLKEAFLLSLLRTVNICRICMWPVILFYSSLRFGGHVWKTQRLLWLMVSLKMLYVDAWGI